MSCCDGLTSRNTMFSSFTHSVTCVRISFFLWLNNIPLIGYIPFCLSIHSSPGAWFYLVAIGNNTAVNMVVQMPVRVPAFKSLGYIPRSGIAGSHSNSTFNFRDTTIVFPVAAAPFLFSPAVHKVPSLSISLPALVISCFVLFFINSHPNG